MILEDIYNAYEDEGWSVYDKGIQTTCDDSKNKLGVPLLLDNGRLSFKNDHVKITLSPWNEGLYCNCSINAISASNFKNQSEFEIQFIEALFLECIQSHDEGVKTWSASIPKVLFNQVMHFPGYAFRMLSLAAQFNDAAQLLTEFAIFLWLIVNVIPFKQYEYQDINRLLSKKRVDILSEIGYAKEKRVLTFLGKISFNKYDSDSYSLIQYWIKSPELSKLNFYPTLSEEHLLFFKKFPQLIGSKLSYNTHEIKKLNSKHETRLIDDTLTMAEQCYQFHQRVTQLQKITNIKRIQEIHDELVSEVNKQAFKKQKVNYALPPVLGNDAIQPICDSYELYLEGKHQNHCVFSYHQRILNREYYVYRIFWPERATLGIDISSGSPYIDQVYLNSNFSVSSETYQFIEQWLELFTQVYKVRYEDNTKKNIILNEFKVRKEAIEYAKSKATDLDMVTNLHFYENVWRVTIKSNGLINSDLLLS